MEVLDKHITKSQIEDFLSQQTNVIWLTLCDELCICYGKGRFNNPANLPTYHTHDKGGIIVCFPDDISFGCVSKTDNNIGIRFLTYMKSYLSLKGKVLIANNDLLYNGRKVLSYSTLYKDNKYISTFHLSVDIDTVLIQNICTKAIWKIPGGLKNFGYTKQELLDQVLTFLKQEEESEFIQNDPIDICVMWVDQKSQRWQKEYTKYKQIELARGTQTLDSDAAFNTARYQDWGIFKYWFRGIEQNCPWVNHVFLIVEDEDQVPSWLNTNHPKLKIVYHKDFIPNDLLPLFNGPAIEMWYSNIPELSENFIACDDDYFFYNPIPSNLFFYNNIPQTEIFESKHQYLHGISIMTWQCMMYNDRQLIEHITGKKYNYKTSHLPEARKKSFEAKILKENYNLIHDAISYSHFRSKNSYTAWAFIDLLKAYNISQHSPIYRNSAVIPLKNITKFKLSYREDYDMICFNDIVGPIDRNIQRTLLGFLGKHFPQKSSWEV